MTTTTTTTTTLIKLPNDPVTQFVVDGGKWGDAMILQHVLDIPILEAKIIAAAKKQNPSGDRYRAKLLSELAEAYSWAPGKKRADADVFVAQATAAHLAERANARAIRAGTATPARANSQDAWTLLDIENE